MDDSPPCPASCLQIELIEGVNKHVFGEGLDVVEQQWLVSELNGWLEAQRGSPVAIDTTEDRAQVTHQHLSNYSGRMLQSEEVRRQLPSESHCAGHAICDTPAATD